MEKYIEMDTFVSNNCIDIKDIDTFETMIKENNISTIFFGKRTARSKYNPIDGKCFLFVINSIFYVFTYHSKYGLYKTIQDYKNAIKMNYINAMTFYSIYDNNKSVIDINEYLLKEYCINEKEILDYEIKYEYKVEKNKYFFNFIEIITEIEKLRKDLNLNNIQGIFAFNLLNNVKEQEINPKEFIDKYKKIYISDQYELSITVSETFINEYDADFIIKDVNEILLKLNKKLFIDKNVNYSHNRLTF